MRFVAISSVVIGHGWFFIEPNVSYLNIVKDFAIFGVEIFFVLSGFLIGSIFIKDMEAKGLSYKTTKYFWKRRWYRTLPNYLLFFLLNTLAFFALKDEPFSHWHYLIFMQNFVWMPEPFFSVSWSLAVEEWFYILLPLCTAVFVLIFSLRFSVFLFSLFVIVTSLSARFYAAYELNLAWNEELRLSVVYRLDSLMFGVLCAWFNYYKSELFNKSQYLFTVGVALMLALLAIKTNGMLKESKLLAVLFFPLSSLAFALMLPKLNNWKSNTNNTFKNGVVNISLWSYSMYLVHVPLLMICKLLASKFPIFYQYPSNFLVFFLWISITVFCSKILYEKFELPMTALRGK